ncbi:MFS general substrate transporter [Punctularia strigosozonata HHB-11173 SS5]|uniref:MFS general substrate transporter n=1 Tax=Punctularia strigosozonata (strain HHB-11173) TaxID=741275 RepID=UPI00044185E4|nr:MFS general substrate transporter [Punctularia strigosozonata HHB-11173 SS5]EIN08414.1 MFS general substrate transporter [Punctularia strigosozonata HHB-11173 SS5]
MAAPVPAADFNPVAPFDDRPPTSRKASQSTLDEKLSRAESGDVGLEVVKYDSGVDVAVGLAAGHVEDAPVGREESRRMRAKLDWRLLPLLFLIYTVQYIDKATLNSSFVLGIAKDAKLTTDEFNTLGSAFYIGYLVFQYPQNLALQRFPVAKWMTFNLFLWSLFLGLHCVCKNFGGLFVLRFLLGAAEGCTTAGLMLITSMFYTRTEIGERIGWTFQCNGVGTIVGGFLAFGVAHVQPTAKPNPWQALYVITCLMTLVVCGLFAWLMPDNPTTARFLRPEEKVVAVRRVKDNQNGIETKKWKREQFIECLKDYKTWLFFFWAAIANLQNGLGTEASRVIKLFGFTTLQTTLLNIPTGFAQILGITLGCWMLRMWPNSRAFIHNIFWIPSILSAFLLIFLPYSNKIGHICAIYLLSFGGAPGFVMMLSWVTSATAGHTKKLATNGIFLIGYALGQILCTQFWKDKYAPKFVVPWIICLCTYAADIAIVCALWYLLRNENARRDALAAQSGGKAADGEFQEYGYVVSVDEKGHEVKTKVEKGLLDLTDRQNLAFRYVL